MDNHFKEALDLVKCQAAVRVMTVEEMTAMAQRLCRGLKALSESEAAADAAPVLDPAKAIKEHSITCVECGKTLKVLTKKHLAEHGLTPETYREKYNYKKGAALVCKSLQRERRKLMKEMRLWERRKA